MDKSFSDAKQLLKLCVTLTFPNPKNPLALSCDASIELVWKLIELGGKDLVMAKCNGDDNILFYAFRWNAISELVQKLIMVGGRDLVLAQNSSGKNVLHELCWMYDRDISSTRLELLVQIGGKDILTQEDRDGKTPMQLFLATIIQHVLYDGVFDEERFIDHNVEELVEDLRESQKETSIRNLSLLVRKYIELKIGGDYAFGGVFNAYQKEIEFAYGYKFNVDREEVRMAIHRHFNKLFVLLFRPALQLVMELPRHRHEPIIQAAITSEAHPDIIRDTVQHFPNSISTVDGTGTYPIDVAIKEKLSWCDGMKEIVDVFASAQQSTPIIVGAKYGLPWQDGMKHLFEDAGDSYTEETMEEETGLLLFMLAAVGGKYNYDLGSVFQLIQARPGCLISTFDDKSDQKKRKYDVLII